MNWKHRLTVVSAVLRCIFPCNAALYGSSYIAGDVAVYTAVYIPQHAPRNIAVYIAVNVTQHLSAEIAEHVGPHVTLYLAAEVPVEQALRISCDHAFHIS